MSTNSKLLALLLGAVFGIFATILIPLILLFDLFQFTPNTQPEQFVFIPICLGFGAILGASSAFVFGELAARFIGKNTYWFSVILGGVLVPTITFLAIFFYLRQFNLEQKNEEYSIVLDWDGQQTMKEFNLSEMDLSGLNLADADFRYANLRGADLSGAYLKGADLEGAVLNEANLEGADLKNARYNSETRWPDKFDYEHSGAIGPHADLSGADLRGANLIGTDLTGANLRGANISGVNLRGAKLDGASLDRARYGALSSRSTYWPLGFDYQHSGAIGPHADLSGADFGESDLSGMNLNDVNLSGSNLSDADLHSVLLWRADLTRADLSGANLRDSILNDADLSGTNLSRANLSSTLMNAARYTVDTIWPANFDPSAAGAILVDDTGNPIED